MRLKTADNVLQELARQHLRATQGPWVAEEHMEGLLAIETSELAFWKRIDIALINVKGKARLNGEAIAALIVLMRNNIVNILDDIQDLQETNKQLAASLKDCLIDLETAEKACGGPLGSAEVARKLVLELEGVE